MRIAVSGTHLVGKTTLVEALGERLAGYAVVSEPYEMLEEEGYEFEHPPSVEDFVEQLRQSLALLRQETRNVIYDRCPVDFVGYIFASAWAERFDLDVWRGRIRAAMTSLDLVVLLPLDAQHEPEMPLEDAAFRLEVDGWLRDLVDGDEEDLCGDVEVLVLSGAWEERVEKVVGYVAGKAF